MDDMLVVNSGTVLTIAIKHPQPVCDNLTFLQILSRHAKIFLNV